MEKEFFNPVESLIKRMGFCKDSDILAEAVRPFVGLVLFPKVSIFKKNLC